MPTPYNFLHRGWAQYKLVIYLFFFFIFSLWLSCVCVIYPVGILDQRNLEASHVIDGGVLVFPPSERVRVYGPDRGAIGGVYQILWSSSLIRSIFFKLF